MQFLLGFYVVSLLHLFSSVRATSEGQSERQPFPVGTIARASAPTLLDLPETFFMQLFGELGLSRDAARLAAINRPFHQLVLDNIHRHLCNLDAIFLRFGSIVVRKTFLNKPCRGNDRWETPFQRAVRLQDENFVRTAIQSTIQPVPGDIEVPWEHYLPSLLISDAESIQSIGMVKDAGTGLTLWHGAIITQNYFVVELLALKGFDFQVRDNFGWTPLVLACTQHEVSIVNLLLRSLHGQVVPGAALQSAFLNDRNEIANLLLDQPNIEVNSALFNTNGPLHTAISANVDLDLIERLMKHANLDINAPGAQGKTALHLAAESGNHKLVDYLLNKRADMEARDLFNRTPRDLAFATMIQRTMSPLQYDSYQAILETLDDAVSSESSIFEFDE